MAKNKRAAETATPPTHREEAEGYLEQIGLIQREIALNKMALAFLIENEREDFLRRKIEINREAMLANPDLASETPGVLIKSTGEAFVIEPVGQKEMAA